MTQEAEGVADCETARFELNTGAWMRNTTVGLLAIALASLVSENARADPDACQPVKEAIGKLNATSQFQQKGTITYINGGKSYSLDYLVSDDKEYSRENDGPWKVSPRQPVPLIVDNKPSVYECGRVGTDYVSGVSAVIYRYKRLTPDRAVRDVRVWVADESGEPLQTEMTIEAESQRKAKFTFSYDPNASLPTVGNQ
ncbi:hypothetical protein [Rhizobium sp. 11_C7_N12_5]|uniref:hypothetical protein n=1 Tax=Rhizobium sp. 11_C7_N12_5 TaxID=3240770 RepID=UPI003F1E4A56